MTALTTEKMAAFAPMPSASVNSATAVNPGLLRSVRRPSSLGSQAPELVWYENPEWTPHVITREAPRMINLAAADADGDGLP